MGRLRIQHESIYRYARNVSFGRHRLVLRPREGHDLYVESFALEIRPAHRLVWARDVFGNSVGIVDFTEDANELTVSTDLVVVRRPKFPTEIPHEPWQVSYPVAYDPLETTIAAAYQSLSYPDDLETLREWLKASSGEINPYDAERTVFALGARIYKEIRYQRRMEKGVQTPAQTIQLGSGSCRDMATLLMEAARSMGIAARFASGYLDCMASEAGRASMHAWTEIYLPTLGWRGFDPTIGEPTSLKHVVVGVSNHPRGVMPISGMFSGTAGDYLQMTATVRIEKLVPERATA
ncbi:transglutaminase family protein [Planctomicrobium piriforme]|uniref:Transglutaminase-like enzyme, putative cysteine protease n=1 Tax=Planctomicrobium piriforme TaxID=1576369 RepID=A0A1I3D8Y2_9PLAN|nr:transglutaminase family protein [Planctomicrobium piriforme]SFH83116.1 Transglutaminase-like enzyme, putative cysteine protease [Planctomicrobium piriforme]